MHKRHKLFKIRFSEIDVHSPETDKTSKKLYYNYLIFTIYHTY